MHYVLIYPIRKVGRQDEVLMGFMKTGAWQSYFNGFGGKFEENESPIQTARRELHEESGIIVDEKDMIYHGHVLFQEKEKREASPGACQCHICARKRMDILIDVFSVRLRKNTVPKITDDATPCWFNSEQLPFENMPPHDKYWINMIFNRNHHHNVKITTVDDVVQNVVVSKKRR